MDLPKHRVIPEKLDLLCWFLEFKSVCIIQALLLEIDLAYAGLKKALTLLACGKN